jgi:hypothetical protein
VPEPTVVPAQMQQMGDDTFLVHLHHRDAEGAAVVVIYVGACDLVGGGFGVSASPQWVRCGDAARMWDTVTWETSHPNDDRYVLPLSYRDLDDADRAARQIAEAIMRGDTTALLPLGTGALAQTFNWDGQPFDPS